MVRLQTGDRNPTVAEMQRHDAEMNAGDLCEDCLHAMIEIGQVAGGPPNDPCQRCGGRSYRTAFFDAHDAENPVLRIMCTGSNHFRVMVQDG